MSEFSLDTNVITVWRQEHISFYIRKEHPHWKKRAAKSPNNKNTDKLLKFIYILSKFLFD
jgi:hypothetical protein